MIWDIAFATVIFLAAIGAGFSLIVAGFGVAWNICEEFCFRDRSTWVILATAPFAIFLAAVGSIMLLAVAWSLSHPNLGFHR